jgi:hypothetical protein
VANLRTKIHGRVWTIQDDTRMKYFGQCIYAEHRIKIRTRQSAQDRLDTLVHELLHACQPGWAEKNVWRTARVISKVLRADKWRRINEL